MNIDPRTIKELVRLQLLNKMSLITGGAASDGEDVFSGLLNSILSGTTEKSHPPADALKHPLKPVSNTNVGFSASTNVAAAAGASRLNGSFNASKFDPLIMDASQRNGVEPGLIKAVID